VQSHFSTEVTTGHPYWEAGRIRKWTPIYYFNYVFWEFFKASVALKLDDAAA